MENKRASDLHTALFAKVPVDEELLARIYSAGADPELEAIRLAVYRRDIDLLSAILKQVSVENFNIALVFSADRGWRAGVIACIELPLSRPDMVSILNLEEALECAGRNSRSEIVSLLVKCGADPKKCIFELAMGDDAEMEKTVKILIAAKAENFGESLMRAACGRRYRTAQALLEVCEIPRIMTRKFLKENPEIPDYLSELIDGDFAIACSKETRDKIFAANKIAGEIIGQFRAATCGVSL